MECEEGRGGRGKSVTVQRVVQISISGLLGSHIYSNQPAWILGKGWNIPMRRVQYLQEPNDLSISRGRT